MNYGTDTICLEGPTTVEQTQFCFHFCNTRQGIYLERLILPSQYMRKRIGSFCVQWLQEFARDFGFKYIVLGSVAEARFFWTKMGFRSLTAKELYKFPGYQGRYTH